MAAMGATAAIAATGRIRPRPTHRRQVAEQVGAAAGLAAAQGRAGRQPVRQYLTRLLR
jgi:hypothetical protein